MKAKHSLTSFFWKIRKKNLITISLILFAASSIAQDTSPPVIQSLTPNDESTEVPLDEEFIVTFDEDVFYANASGFITARRKSDGQSIASIAISGITFSTNQITFSFSSDLPSNTDLYLTIDANKIEDGNGNLYSGFFDDETWDFSTGDPPGPVFNFGSPADGSTDVSISNNIIILYDQPIQKGTGFIRVKQFSNDALLHSFDVEGTGISTSGTSISVNSSVLIPNALPPETHLYVEVDASAVESTGGIVSTAINKGDYSFTTGPIVWNGFGWNNGSSPNENDPVRIESDYTFSDDGSFECGKLTVNAGATLTVDGDDLLTINGSISNDGNIIIESGSSLFTYETTFLSGNDITIKRNTRYADGRYSFVGTPVADNVNVTGADLGSHVYKYNEATPYGTDGITRWEDASADELIPGKGYTQAGQKEIVFVGEPVSGSVFFEGTYTNDTDDANEGWNLVANPYAAAIDVADFLASNTNTTGAIYIWDDNGSDAQRGTNADYIVANGTMATNTTPAGGQTRYNQAIGSTQGFFIKLNDDTDTEITFDEDMRLGSQNSDDNFFRETPLPKVRINLTNNEGLFKQTVIGIAEDATNTELNRAYDAEAFNSTADNGLFTIKAGRTLSLNGMTHDWESIQLQLNTAEAGIYEISLELEEYDESIYLRDNLTGEVTDLRVASYSFTAQAGINTNRFELVSRPQKVLGLNEDKVMVYAHNNVLYIQPSDNSEREYLLFDMNGKQLQTTSTNIKTEINLATYRSGIYLVFDGQKTHKIILK